MPPPLRISLLLLLSVALTAPHATTSPYDLRLVSQRSAHSKHGGPITSLLYLEDRIGSCSQAGILHTDLDGADPIWLKDIPFRPYALALVDGDDPMIAAAGGKPGETGEIALLDPKNLTILAQRSISKDLVYSISVDLKSNTIAAACNDGTVATLPLDDLQDAPITIRHRHTAIARDVAFSPDGKWLASAGHDGVVLISEWPPPGEEDKPEVRSLSGHTGQVHCLAFSPDSDVIASGSKDGKVRLHKVEGPLLRTYAELDREPVSDLLWDSGLVASSLGGTLHLLAKDDDSAHRLAQFPGPVFAITSWSEATWAVGTHQVEFLTTPSNRRRPGDSAR